jgi:uncharacterized protein YbjT (DUF2867 family)
VRVLLTGASGFLGRHIAAGLCSQGHEVICGLRGPSRDPPAGCTDVVTADFTRDHEIESWLPRLTHVDAVINAVGIFREQGTQTFESLHVRAPRALFDACLHSGVERIVQISALGADPDATSAYHISKRRADVYLSGLPLFWTIVQPSLVYGPGGTSARLFNALASLPLIPLPRGGTQLIQPIHIDDFVEGITRVLTDGQTLRRVVPFVGPKALPLRDYLGHLRAGLGLGAARVISLPMPLVRAAAQIGAFLPGSLFDSQSLAMLERGNTGEARPLEAVLHHPPREPSLFVSADERAHARVTAQLAWLLPVMRVSLAFVWIFTAIVSFGLYPISSSYAMLARIGIPAVLAPLFLYGAATLDLLLGIATLVLRRRRALWLIQAMLIVVYTVLITWRMPELWLHPFGPVLKNAALLAMIGTLYVLEKR